MLTEPPLKRPTSHLPHITNIRYTSIQELRGAVNYLRLLYNPVVRGTRCVGRHRVYPCPSNPDHKPAFQPPHEPESTDPTTNPSPEEVLSEIRADSYERSHTIRWLTSLISQADRLESIEDDGDKLVQNAAALLAVCAGTASAGTITRTFSFKGHTGQNISVQLTDAPLENQDFSSVGAQTWGSSCVLSEMIVQSPSSFGLEYRPIRVLELGSGTGLVSLTIAALLRSASGHSSKPHTGWSIVATDFHPTVLRNLENNADILRRQSNPSHLPIDIYSLDWSTFLDSPRKPPFDEPFDLLFASDVVYETEQAKWIKNCVEVLLRKPASSVAVPPRFYLVVPVRPTHSTEMRLLEEVFPFADALLGPEAGKEPETIFLGTISKELLHCEIGSGIRKPDTNLVQYAFFTIAWGVARK